MVTLVDNVEDRHLCYKWKYRYYSPIHSSSFNQSRYKLSDNVLVAYFNCLLCFARVRVGVSLPPVSQREERAGSQSSGVENSQESAKGAV